MKISITEEMKFRQRVVEYAIKHDNNAKAARRYDTSRQQVQRWRKKYNETLQSLTNKSRRPHSHPRIFVHTLKIPYPRKSDIQKLIHKYIHIVASESNFSSHRHTLSNLEILNGFLRFGYNGFLTH